MKLLILVAPDFNLATTAGFLDPFRAANYLDGTARFTWSIVSAAGGACKASNGMVVETDSLTAVRGQPFDLVIVSSSWTPERSYTAHIQAALRQWARQGSAIGALDTGAFVLAKAGLLDDRKATVHYEHLDALGELYPSVQAVEDLYVVDGNRLTCCGGAASTDLALHIIKSVSGEFRANAAARYIFHERLRPAATRQNPGASEPIGRSAPAVVRTAIDAMEAHLEEPLPIPEICRSVGVSQRQLDRLFSRYVKRTPAAYYRDIRLDRARGLVTQTDMRFGEIAIASGFSSTVHFSRAYRQRFGLSPSQDRLEGRLPFEYRAWPMHPGATRVSEKV